MIDLSKFVAKNVRVTFRDGSIKNGYIEYTPSLSTFQYDYQFCYDFKYKSGYTKLGEFWAGSVIKLDIIHIEEIKPMSKYEELEKKVAEMQKEIDRLKAEEKKKPEITIENSKVGDVLEDGCVVVDKQGNMALLAAPATTEVRCSWSKEFSEVFDSLKSQGFNPSQWFIPTEEQLKIAYENCKQHFTSGFYWSSAEFNSLIACSLSFDNGFIGSSYKSFNLYVRAFRWVSF